MGITAMTLGLFQLTALVFRQVRPSSGGNSKLRSCYVVVQQPTQQQPTQQQPTPLVLRWRVPDAAGPFLPAGLTPAPACAPTGSLCT